MMKLTTALISLSLLMTGNTWAAGKSAVFDSNAVYSWRTARGTNAYSDIPLGLRMDYANKMSVRTHSVFQANDVKHKTPQSLAERQLELAKETAEQQQKIENDNKRIQEANAKIKQENCQQARSNLHLAEQARNREQLVPKYNSDIARYCN